MTPNDDASNVALALSAYFPQGVVGWKPQAINGNRAMAVAYIDARDVMDRLDAAVGVGNWSDRYESRADGNVVCTLSLRINGEWVGKTDVGGESDQKDDGDKCKAAFSDAFKRAAVKWGIGRYLYSLPKQWVDYDPQKKAFAREPVLPAWALPGTAAARPVPAPAAAPKPPANVNVTLPKNGQEFYDRLMEMERILVRDGKKTSGQLLRELNAFGDTKRPPYPQLVQNWNPQQIADGVEWVRAERARVYQPKEPAA